jgi:hypothetical protein
MKTIYDCGHCGWPAKFRWIRATYGMELRLVCGSRRNPHTLEARITTLINDSYSIPLRVLAIGGLAVLLWLTA